MKKKLSILLCVLLFVVSLFTLAACGSQNGNPTDTNPPITDNSGNGSGGNTDNNNGNNNDTYQGSTIPVNGELYNTSSIYTRLTITAGNEKLDAILFDNKTARAVADMLPITVSTWHPAPNFARAFDLPSSFSYFSDEPAQMSYELGSLAYWAPGPSIAMIYNASRTETVVPVVPIGKITSNLNVLENYSGTITVEIAAPVEQTNLKITAGSEVITAVLNDTALANEIKDRLPVTLSMSKIYDREYYGNSLPFTPASDGQTQTRFENGDLTYWGRGNSLAVYYSQGTNPVVSSGIIVIGKITSDLSVFDRLPNNITMTFEIV